MNLYAHDNSRFQRIDIRSLKEKTMETKPLDNVNDPTNSAVPPGYRSTEFWLSTAATIIGIILASGLLSPADPTQAKVLQILGLVATTLAALGYTAVRGYTKGKAIDGAAFVAASKGLAVPPQPSEPK